MLPDGFQADELDKKDSVEKKLQNKCILINLN